MTPAPPNDPSRTDNYIGDVAETGVATLEPRLVGKISQQFFVPGYQRGYRWGLDEVSRLLNDIWESRNQSYYLQPVVVKAQPSGDWELIDGQQRLTTLFLIFQYMQKEGLQNAGPPFTLRYDTRQDSAAYLQDLDEGRSAANIDFHHIYVAYRCIAQWFDNKRDERQYVANKFYDALYEHVRVIWYEAPEELDSTDLFVRLNVGRIPLTDAELVKALLLSRSRAIPGASDRANEIAAQWDSFERDLRQRELWSFITGKATDEATHIRLLLDLLAPWPRGSERPLFYTFETLREEIIADPQRFWDRVVRLHSLLLGWYEDRNLYHKIGFLIAEGATLDNLVDLAHEQLQSAFNERLNERIAARMKLSEADVRALTYHSTMSGRCLLLMNVLTVLGRSASSERYSFREHARGRWSLEHIHAQSAESLTTVDQWRQWLQLHRDALRELDEVSDEAKKHALLDRVATALNQPTITADDFKPLEYELLQFLSPWDDEGSDVDSIANLALLDGGDNSALSNSVFAAKRVEVLKRDREGSYIPVCTRNAFLKYYTPAAEHHLHFWSADDRAYYLDELVEVLRPYLTAEGNAE